MKLLRALPFSLWSRKSICATRHSRQPNGKSTGKQVPTRCSAIWSAPAISGFAPTQIAQAIPTASGPDLYST